MLQLISERRLWEPHHPHYIPQYGDKKENKKVNGLFFYHFFLRVVGGVPATMGGLL